VAKPKAESVPPPPATLGPSGQSPTEDDVRRWLTDLRRPDRLGGPEVVELLRARGRRPTAGSPLGVGAAAREMLLEAIDRLKPEGRVSREQELPYLVLRTCFVDGAKHVAAAERLGMSPRQLTRERARAIRLLHAELAAAGDAPSYSTYRPEPIPAIASFLPRPAATRALSDLLAENQLVHVHGPKGIGKTSLVAELASSVSRKTPVFWYRFRAGVNTTLAAVALDLGEYLAAGGRPALADYLTEALPQPDIGIVSRLAIRCLTGSPQLVVFDDDHLAEDDPAVAGFIEEAVVRLPTLRVVTVGRHREIDTAVGTSYALPAMTRLEAQALLAQLGVRTNPLMGESIHSWTEGLPNLVTLAASWLKSAAPEDVASGVQALTEQEGVQEFLLAAISEVLDSADRAILDAASVFRDRFTDESLAFVSQQTVGTVQDASRRLVRRHLATRSRNGDVAFFHGSVREHFYARLTPESRRAIHERAAEWYRGVANRGEAAHHARAAKS
jgi:ATP/maltotriose-dependent transcriptional regulator MalT